MTNEQAITPLHGKSIFTEAHKHADLIKFFQHQMSTGKNTDYHLFSSQRDKILQANVGFYSCLYCTCSLLPVCSCNIEREGEWVLDGLKGPPNSFGSSCIRVNGTNYKSRAISPHYSAGTRRRQGGEGGRARVCLTLKLSVGDEGKTRKAEQMKNYMKNRYGETSGGRDKAKTGCAAVWNSQRRKL